MENTDNDIQSNLTVRDTFVADRLALLRDFSHPEKVRWQASKEVKVFPLDIGALAYTIRQPQKSNHLAHLPYLVDESSFMPSRRKLLVALHDYISITGNNDQTVIFHLGHFIRAVMWLDTHGHSDAFESKEAARKGYIAFVAELNHQIKLAELNTINPKSAYEKQYGLVKLLGLYWGDETSLDITREIPTIRYKRQDSEAPEEQSVRLATQASLHLARGFKSVVMNNKAFPFLLKMRDYECYVFNCNINSCVTPYTDSKNANYHYEEGRIATPEEYIAASNREIKMYEARNEVNKSTKKLSLINADSRHPFRLSIASIAMQNYAQLFILMTGAYPSELAQLEYDDSYSLEKDLLKNDFRAIKMRAAGREVVYHLGNLKGLVVFKEYIQLRNWVLNGLDYPYLFFAIEKKGTHTENFHKLKSHNVQRFLKSFKGKFLPASFEIISARKARKYKTVVWNELDIAQEDIAKGLNHDLKTNQRCYAVSSPDRQQNELGLFFESANAAAKLITARVKKTEQIPIVYIHNNDHPETTKIGSGHCNDFKHPEAMEDEPPIKPDCTSQMGCLYCEHYVCHADKEDIKKLYSLLYVIEAVRKMATDFSHSDKLLLELTMRIQLVLKQMSDKSADIGLLVDEIKNEVMEHGILTSFWEFRLQRYEQMGVMIQ